MLKTKRLSAGGMLTGEAFCRVHLYIYMQIFMCVCFGEENGGSYVELGAVCVRHIHNVWF